VTFSRTIASTNPLSIEVALLCFYAAARPIIS